MDFNTLLGLLREQKKMAPATTPKLRLPLAYTLWFTWIDPVLSLLGAYGGLSEPNLLLISYIPATIPNPTAPTQLLPNPNAVVNPAHTMIFNQLAGFFILTFTLSAFMLRSTNDLSVWKFYQGAISVVDIIILAATAVEYSHQGRLAPDTWRPEDWFSVLVTAGCAVLRIAFVLGIGLNTKRKTN